MLRSFTVYFDTSFFVQLSCADESLADTVIDELNSLQVRHVLSETILSELLTKTTVPDRDATLVERVGMFNIPPFQTRADLDWIYLLVTGQEREAVADAFRRVDAEMVKAVSWSLMARRLANGKPDSRLLESAKDLLQKFGFPEDLSKDTNQTVTASKALVEKINQLLPEELKIKHIDWPDDASPENLSKLSEQLIAQISPAHKKLIEDDYKLQESVTRSEDRPYQVAADIATDNIKKRLANTFRDTKHMRHLITHRDEIDILQVDRSQWEMINRTNPPHFLAEQGLSERCFFASSLKEVAVKVGELRASKS
jgi:predicted nucleic acid-binding protein